MGMLSRRGRELRRSSCWCCAVRCVVPGCTMPVDWRGTWYEAGVGDVTITTYGILNKGLCVDKTNDFYLLDNRWHSRVLAIYIQWCFSAGIRSGFSFNFDSVTILYRIYNTIGKALMKLKNNAKTLHMQYYNLVSLQKSCTY